MNTRQAALGMGNKFHKSAALAMAKRYTAAEAVGILEQYRREVAAHGRERGVQTPRIGQWFSGQLKSLDAQLKEGAFFLSFCCFWVILSSRGFSCFLLPCVVFRAPKMPPHLRALHATAPFPSPHKSIPTALVVSPLLELPAMGSTERRTLTLLARD